MIISIVISTGSLVAIMVLPLYGTMIGIIAFKMCKYLLIKYLSGKVRVVRTSCNPLPQKITKQVTLTRTISIPKYRSETRVQTISKSRVKEQVQYYTTTEPYLDVETYVETIPYVEYRSYQTMHPCSYQPGAVYYVTHQEPVYKERRETKTRQVWKQRAVEKSRLIPGKHYESDQMESHQVESHQVIVPNGVEYRTQEYTSYQSSYPDDFSLTSTTTEQDLDLFMDRNFSWFILCWLYLSLVIVTLIGIGTQVYFLAQHLLPITIPTLILTIHLLILFISSYLLYNGYKNRLGDRLIFGSE